MGSPQNPDVVSSPYQAPDAPAPDMNAPAPPINTPGLAVPQPDPAAMGPPAPEPVPPVDGVPQALALATPDVGVPRGLAPPVPVGPQNPAQSPGQYTLPPGFGGPVGEARRAAVNDKKENEQVAKDLAKASDQEIMAQNAASRVQQAEAADKAVAMSEQRAQMAKLDAQEQAGNVAYQTKRADLDAKYEKAIKDQDSFVFDPDQYIHNMSLGSQIFTVIAIGLSGMGNSRSIGGSGENLALKGLNDSIQANVDAQKESYRRLGDRVARAQNAYGRAREMHMDDAQATLAARQAAIGQHEMAIKTITARYDPDRIDAARQQMVAHLATESAKTQQQMTQNSHAEASRARSESLNAASTVFGMGVQAENLALNREQMQLAHEDRQSALAEKALAAQQKAQGKAGGVPSGWVGEAPVTNEQKNKAAELSGTERILTRKLGEMLQFKSDYGNEAMNRSEIAKVKSTAAQVKVALKDKFGLGVMSDADSELLDNVARDPSKVSWTPATTAQLQHLIEQIHADTDDQMEGYGLRRDPEYKARAVIPFKEAEGGK